MTPSPDPSGRLVRGVKCPRCRRTNVRHPSGFCQDHRRDSLSARSGTVLPGGVVVDRPRAAETSVLLSDPDPSWAHEARRVGDALRAARPTLRVDPAGNLRVLRALTDSYSAEDASRDLRDRGVSARLDGADVLVRASDGSTPAAALRAALDLADASYLASAEDAGLLTGYAERYDDRAEVLAAVGLPVPPGRRVSYGVRPATATSPESVSVRLSSLDGVGEGSVARLVRSVRPAPPDPETGSVRVLRLYESTPSDESDVALVELSLVAATVLDAADEGSVSVEGELYLPVGWNLLTHPEG